MAAFDPSVTLRAATPADCDIAIELIMHAADGMLVDIFGGGDRTQTIGFLKTAWHIQNSQFGFGLHTIACIEDEPVGICTHWVKSMPESFVKDTARAMLNFYTLEDAKLAIDRSKHATLAILPPEHNEIIIGHLAVLPAFQRRGIGRLLIEDAQRKGAELGKSVVGLDVARTNHDAITFYQALGFCCIYESLKAPSFAHMTKPL